MSVFEMPLEEMEGNDDELFPFGLPDKLDFKLLLTNVSKVENVINTARTCKSIKTLKKAGVVDDYLTQLKGVDSLSEKQKMAVFHLCSPANRSGLREKGDDLKLYEYTVEGMLLVRYAKAKGFGAELGKLSCLDSFTGKYPVYFKGKSEKALIMALFQDANGFGETYPEIFLRLLGAAWDDLDNTELEENAAFAFFAIASCTESLVMMDFLYESKPELFKRYFSSLIKGKELKPFCGPVKYTSRFGDNFNFKDFKEGLFARKLLLNVVNLGFRLTRKSETDNGNIDMIRLQDTVNDAVVKLEVLKEDIDNAGCEKIKVHLDCLSDNVIETFRVIKVIYERESMAEDQCNKITLKLKELKSQMDSSNAVAVRDACDLFCDAINGSIESYYDTQDELIDLQNAFNEYVHDPVLNSKEIQKVCAEIEKVKASSLSSYAAEVKNIEDAFDILVACDLSLKKEREQVAPANVEPEHQGLDGVGLDVVKQEHKNELEAVEHKMAQMQEAMQAERSEIEKLKASRLKDGMSQEARKLMQKVNSDITLCSIPELLKCIQLLYPNSVAILPSAVKSAKSSPFQNKAALWKALVKLTSDYLVQINSGVADTVARKVFTTSMYAANESKTVSCNNKLKVKRIGHYNGKAVNFDKHLRFGTARNKRDTLRLHFAVCDNKIVIFHCGKHLEMTN